jgi:6-phosphogluconate dehydrogenase (decarboxylating)
MCVRPGSAGPAGEATAGTIAERAALLAPGRILIDGGNSVFKDPVDRSLFLGVLVLHFF